MPERKFRLSNLAQAEACATPEAGTESPLTGLAKPLKVFRPDVCRNSIRSKAARRDTRRYGTVSGNEPGAGLPHDEQRDDRAREYKSENIFWRRPSCRKKLVGDSSRNR